LDFLQKNAANLFLGLFIEFNYRSDFETTFKAEEVAI
jgi:hypothetical protein